MKTKNIVLCSLAIAVNIVLSFLAKVLALKFLFLDTVGTILSAVTLGPIYGAIVGFFTNIINGILTGDMREAFFAIVNVVIALIVGYIAKKFGFSLKQAIITGIILAVIAPCIGTPIAVLVYGGLSGGIGDVFILWLKSTGAGIFESVFSVRLIENLIDKIISCILVWTMIKYIPKEFKTNINISKQ